MNGRGRVPIYYIYNSRTPASRFLLMQIRFLSPIFASLMDYYNPLRQGRGSAPSSIAKRPRNDYGEYGRECEFYPFGAPRIEGNDLLSTAREHELNAYRMPHTGGHDLLSSGRKHDLDSYKAVHIDGYSLLASSREREQGRKLDPYRSRMEGHDLLSSGRGREIDSHKLPWLEERDLLTSGRGREHDPYGRPNIEGRYEDSDLRGSWRERDPLVGIRDSLRARSIKGAGGLLSTDLGGIGLSMASSRAHNASHDDPAMMGQGPRFDVGVGLSGRQGQLDRNGLKQDFEATQGAADSATGPVLFVDGLPADCTRREADHIFRPFIGFKEVRVVHKEPKRPGGEKLVLCFAEFADARYARTALEALQGYKFDEREPQSGNLRLSFARYPSSKSAAYRDATHDGRDLEVDHYSTRFLRW